MFEPIVIIGTPRSFTSLTAGIFRDHGVWFGKTREYHFFAPTGSCENYRMKRILKTFSGSIVIKGEECPPFPEFEKKINEVMRDEDAKDPIGFKHSAMFHTVWDFCKPKFICCRRSKEAVCKSGVRTGMVAANADSWEKHQIVMDKIVDAGKGVNVHGEEYFSENWSSIEKAFEFCGLEFKQEIAEKLIDHKHKHF